MTCQFLFSTTAVAQQRASDTAEHSKQFQIPQIKCLY